MASLEEYAKSERTIQNAKRPRQAHPKGWEPRVDTSKKEIVSKSSVHEEQAKIPLNEIQLISEEEKQVDDSMSHESFELPKLSLDKV